jgi:hypothetical protein
VTFVPILFSKTASSQSDFPEGSETAFRALPIGIHGMSSRRVTRTMTHETAGAVICLPGGPLIWEIICSVDTGCLPKHVLRGMRGIHERDLVTSGHSISLV